MKIKLKLGDGSITEIDAFWHPRTEIGGIATSGTQTREAGLWTTDTILEEHLIMTNRFRKSECLPERDLSAGIGEIVRGTACAEAPLEVYEAGDCEQPWKCTGNLIREIPAGEVDAD